MCSCRHYMKTGYSCRLASWREEQRRRSATFTPGQIVTAIQNLTPVCRRLHSGQDAAS